MTEQIIPRVSSRHGFKYREVATVRASVYGGSIAPLGPADYGLVLDSVFEMADAVSNGNGVSAQAAVQTVLRDEGWRVIPSHQRMIVARLEAP